MAQQKVPDSPTLHYTYYKNLRGLDVSHNSIEIDRTHAASMLNMRPDSSDGAPVKRVGWRTIKHFDYEIIASFHDVYDGFDLVADERNLWTVKEDQFTLLRSFNSSVKSIVMAHYDGLVYIIGWGQYFTVNLTGDTVTYSDVVPKIPLTVISRKPDGTSGTDYEGVNALNDQRMISFFSETSSTTYKLYPAGTESDHNITAINKVETMGSSGWTATTAYTWNASTQTITFTTAPGQSASGQDNVRITFTETSTKLTTLRNEIMSAKIATVDDKRLFVVAGANKIYYSDSDNLTSFPDNNYIVTGNDAPIVGLHKRGGYLYSVTGDSSEHSVFVISKGSHTKTKTVINEDFTVGQEEEIVTYFSVSASVAGTGAIAPKSFFPLVDDPLFLGKNGIYGITTNAVTTETIVGRRSTYINPLIRKELALDKAVATVHDGMYILSINGKCFVLDSRETYRDKSKSTCYEGYYWELHTVGNEILTTMLSYDGNLYFGTNGSSQEGKNGRWCKFNTDIQTDIKYKDDEAFNVEAHYTFRLDDDDLPQYFKTMQKKGCVITLKPYKASSVTAYFSKNGDNMELIGTYSTEIMGWENIDFSKFTFVSSASARDNYARKKIKKYKRLQIMFENNNAEPFGIMQFTKTWTVGNFAKG